MSIFLFFYFCSYLIVFSQERIINGFISDENGNPIPFAHIKNVNSGDSFSSDVNGNFNLVNTTDSYPYLE